jgi:cysteine sulfinate desulfinase/cysteine desulfurase-like protein
VPQLIYLDHNATTPDSSFFLLHSSFPGVWGNPSSAYKFWSKLKGVIETVRAQVAELVGPQPRAIGLHVNGSG